MWHNITLSQVSLFVYSANKFIGKIKLLMFLKLFNNYSVSLIPIETSKPLPFCITDKL
jgi:hypothetical protein